VLPRAEIINQAKEPSVSTGLTEGAGTTLTLKREIVAASYAKARLPNARQI